MDKEKRRLRRLEEEAGRRLPASGKRRRPSDHDEGRALDQGMEAWFVLMRNHGWSDEELVSDLERTKTVNRRCRDSELDDWEVMKDMIGFVDAGGEWHDYPGPGYWLGGGRGGSNVPMRVR